jgi:hypothetical protein
LTLSDRTWIVATAGSRGVASAALSKVGPSARGPARPDPRDPVVALHVPGVALARIAERAQVRLLAPLLRSARSCEVALRVDAEPAVTDVLEVSLALSSPADALEAAQTLRDLAVALARRWGTRWAWLADARVDVTGDSVVARAPMPPWSEAAP